MGAGEGKADKGKEIAKQKNGKFWILIEITCKDKRESKVLRFSSSQETID